MELKELLEKAYDLQGSDIFIVPGAHVTCKVKGKMVNLTDDIVKPVGTQALVEQAKAIGQEEQIRDSALHNHALEVVVAECVTHYHYETPEEARERVAQMRAIRQSGGVAGGAPMAGGSPFGGPAGGPVAGGPASGAPAGRPQPRINPNLKLV